AAAAQRAAASWRHRHRPRGGGGAGARPPPPARYRAAGAGAARAAAPARLRPRDRRRADGTPRATAAAQGRPGAGPDRPRSRHMIPLVVFLLACAAVYLGTILAAFSALMRFSLRMLAESTGGSRDILGRFLENPDALFFPARLLLGL